jgi:DNA-binding ferritin-like protein
MTQNHSSQSPSDVLDELVERLLICGGVLSQMITTMAKSSAEHGVPADSPQVLDVAHELIRSILGPVTARHPAAEIETAAAIVDEVTTEICEEIYVRES